MHRANRDFTFEGEEYRAGVTHVSPDHPALAAHPDCFERGNASTGRGVRSEIRATHEGKTEPLYTSEEVRAQLLEMARSGQGERAGQFDGARRPRDTAPGHEAREAGLRALDTMEVSSEAGDRLDTLIRSDRAGIDSRYIAAVASPHYLSAFWKRLAQPDAAQHEYTREEAEATRVVAEVMSERAMAEGSGATGGFGVPYQLDPTIQLTSDGSVNPIRELATVTPITTMSWRGVNSAGVTAAFGDEASEAADASPTLAQPSIDAEKAVAFVPFSIEVGQDWGGLQEELTRLFVDAKDNLEADRFTFGTAANNEPQGILVGGTAQVTTASTAVYAIADLYSLQQAPAPRFQPNAAFLMSNTVKNVTRRFVAAGSTSEPTIFSDDQAMLLGRPFHELSTLSSATTTSGALIAVYGDLARAYRIVDRIGLSVELIPHLFGSNRRPTGQRGLYAYWRVGAAVTNPLAIRVLKVR